MHTDSSFSYFKSCLHIDDERGGRVEVAAEGGAGKGRERER